MPPNPVEKKAQDIAKVVEENAAAWTAQNTDELAASIMALWGGLIEPILRVAAIEVRPCKGCGVMLAMVRNQGKAGVVVPYDLHTGINHFATCPSRERFRRGPDARTLPANPVHDTVAAVDAGAVDKAEQQRLDGIPAGRMPG